MSQWFFSMQNDAFLQSWVGKQNWLKANFSSRKANWNLNGKGNHGQECDKISCKTRGGRKNPNTPCRPLIVLFSSWPLCFNFPQRNQRSSSFRSKIPLLISFARKISVLFHTALARYKTINQLIKIHSMHTTPAVAFCCLVEFIAKWFALPGQASI